MEFSIEVLGRHIKSSDPIPCIFIQMKYHCPIMTVIAISDSRKTH